jgi:hypothetical protein
MAERRSGVGISNREPPEEEARERRQHPAQVEPEAVDSDTAETEQNIPDGQSSNKSGSRSSAQKDATTRHTEDATPASSKVQGAFGKETE